MIERRPHRYKSGRIGWLTIVRKPPRMVKRARIRMRAARKGVR